MKQVMPIFLACLLWLGGPSAAFSKNAQISKLEPITLESSDSVTMLTAEIADTEELRTRGLMFRHFLPPDKAMLFDYETRQKYGTGDLLSRATNDFIYIWRFYSAGLLNTVCNLFSHFKCGTVAAVI